MIAVLKNNFYRLLCRWGRIVAALLLTAVAILAAVFFSAKSDAKPSIALIAGENTAEIASPYLKITRVDQAPPLSELVSARYDAYVTPKGDGSYEVQTIKSGAYKAMLLTILKDPQNYHPAGFNARGIGTNIVGYLMMFILLQGVVLMYMFSDDKEQKQIVRIAASPLSFSGYLLAHCLFTFGFIFLPTLPILYIIKGIMGVDIGFSFGQYVMLLALISALATGFSLFVNSLAHKSDTANMVGSSITLLTSILAGSFYSFEKGNQALDIIIKILPQKAFLIWTDGLEKGAALVSILPWLIYVLALTAFFLAFAFIKTRRDYVGSH